MAYFVKKIPEDQEVKNSDRYLFDVELKRQQYFNKKLKGNAWHYYVAGFFRGDVVNLDFVPGGKDDRGGYGLMDLIFGFYGGNSVPLYAIDYSYTNKDGDLVEGTNYELYFDDVENLDEYVCPVRPSRSSDTELMTTLVKRYKRKLAANLAASTDSETGELIETGGVPPTPETPAEKPEKNKKG